MEITREAPREPVEALDRMLPQLSATRCPSMIPPPSTAVLRCDANAVLLARSGAPIAHTLTLTLVMLPRRAGPASRASSSTTRLAATDSPDR